MTFVVVVVTVPEGRPQSGPGLLDAPAAHRTGGVVEAPVDVADRLIAGVRGGDLGDEVELCVHGNQYAEGV